MTGSGRGNSFLALHNWEQVLGDMDMLKSKSETKATSFQLVSGGKDRRAVGNKRTLSENTYLTHHLIYLRKLYIWTTSCIWDYLTACLLALLTYCWRKASRNVCQTCLLSLRFLQHTWNGSRMCSFSVANSSDLLDYKNINYLFFSSPPKVFGVGWRRSPVQVSSFPFSKLFAFVVTHRCSPFWAEMWWWWWWWWWWL